MQFTKTRDRLEIVIPPAGFQLDLLFLIPFAIVWNSIVFMFFIQTMSPVVIFHAIVGLVIIWQIVSILFEQIRIEVDKYTVVVSKEILGLRLGAERTALRSQISNIEIVPITTEKKTWFASETTISGDFQLNLWLGVNKLEISKKGQLSYPEIHWLAQELSTRLNLDLQVPFSIFQPSKERASKS